MGSQWSSRSTCVMWSQRRVPVISRAVAFCTDCNLRSRVFGRPRRRLPHLHSTPPSGGRSPSEYCHDVWYGKTRMVWLSDGEKNLIISLLVLTQFTNVTDGRTDGQTVWRILHDGIGRAYAYFTTQQKSIWIWRFGNIHSLLSSSRCIFFISE